MNEEKIVAKVQTAMDEILAKDQGVKDVLDLVTKQTQLVQDGASIAELKGITPEQLEAVYSVGFNFYRTGRYDDAEKIFKPLVFLDFYNAKYAFAYGSCLQAQRKFAQATKAYAVVTILDVEDPRPLYHSAECLLALGDREEALAALNSIEALSVAKDERSRTFIAKAAALKAKIEGRW